jgi:hypothetical protein
MSNKEQVSVDECIEVLHEYISKQWNSEIMQDLAKSSLELLILKIENLKRLKENVKKLIKECELELHEDEKYCKCTIIDLLESLDK